MRQREEGQAKCQPETARCQKQLGLSAIAKMNPFFKGKSIAIPTFLYFMCLVFVQGSRSKEKKDRDRRWDAVEARNVFEDISCHQATEEVEGAEVEGHAHEMSWRIG